MRLENAYQKMFHPTRGVEESQKKKHIGKAVGLWIGTLGLLPLVAGISHLIKKIRAKHKTPQDLTPTDNRMKSVTNSTLSRSRSPSLSETPTSSPSGTRSASPSISSSSSDGPQNVLPPVPPEVKVPETTPLMTPNASDVATQIDPTRLASEWKAKLRETKAKADAGDVNARYQLLRWQAEYRNLGDVEKITEDEVWREVTNSAIKAKNPEAMFDRIAELYKELQSAQSTTAIEKEINVLRGQLEALKTPEAEVAKAKLWGLNKVSGDDSDSLKLRKAADEGNTEALYQLGIKNYRIYGLELKVAADKGHPGAIFAVADYMRQGVIELENPQDKDRAIVDQYAQAAARGHKGATGALIQFLGEDSPEAQKWLRPMSEMYE